jgi:hypothetical protein
MHAFFKSNRPSSSAIGWLPLAVACAAAVLFATGCGSDSSTGASGNELTKAALIKQGDAICKDVYDQRTKDVYAYIGKNPKSVDSKKGQEALVIAAMLPPAAAGTEKLEGLVPPEDDQQAYEEFVQGLEEALNEAIEKPLNMLAGVTSAKSNPFNGAKEVAARYGFKVCPTAF